MGGVREGPRDNAIERLHPEKFVVGQSFPVVQHRNHHTLACSCCYTHTCYGTPDMVLCQKYHNKCVYNSMTQNHVSNFQMNVDECRCCCQANADSVSLPAGQLFGEEDVTQLGLSICGHAAVLSMSEVQVIDVKAAMPVHC